MIGSIPIPAMIFFIEKWMVSMVGISAIEVGGRQIANGPGTEGEEYSSVLDDGYLFF